MEPDEFLRLTMALQMHLIMDRYGWSRQTAEHRMVMALSECVIPKGYSITSEDGTKGLLAVNTDKAIKTEN